MPTYENKWDQLFHEDVDNFFASQGFARVLELGMYANIWFSQIGVV